MDSNLKELPVIALRGRVFFPEKSVVFDIMRKKSVLALEKAMKSGGIMFFAAQKEAADEDIKKEDIYTTGVTGKIEQILKLPGGITRVYAQCLEKFKIVEFNDNEEFFSVDAEEIKDIKYKKDCENIYFEYRAILGLLIDKFDEYVKVGKAGPEFIMNIITSESIDYITYTLGEKIPFSINDKQKILEETDALKRGELVVKLLNDEINVLDIKKDLQTKVKRNIDKTQREYFLKEEMRVIKEELGEADGVMAEAEEYEKRMNDIKAMPKEVKERLLKEIERFKKIATQSSESTVSRDYIELILDIPWGIFDKESERIKDAWKILDKDHYGLKEVKERIIEFLAVRKMSDNINSPIICLVGPPGVGKTSVVKSVAKALNRKYIRISLGGISDEAEIRGHRKTYVGAMPGRIVNSVKNAKTMNPLILFDEIDKIKREIKGDPAAALLEVLDGEQNFAFRDNYLELPLDVSKVMFMCTANSADDILPALKDRLEIINIGSYTHEEKLNIALKYLVGKKLKANGLDRRRLKFSKESISEIISGYTREAGVRGLERAIEKICRKTAKKILFNEAKTIDLKKTGIEEFLGARKYKDEYNDKNDKIGVVTGLAWTRVGGDTLSIETVIMKGKGKFKLTGNVGKVMEESAETAISYIRANAEKYKIYKDFENIDIHIHIPEGAVPKDGPSAGITMTLSIISAMTKKPVRHNIAMTGEITLTGRILPIGGLKEKVIAAKMFGIEKLLLPYENESDFKEVPDYAKEGIEVIFVKDMEEVVKEGLV